LEISLLDIAPAASLRVFLSRNTRIRYRCADLYMTRVDDIIDVTDMRLYDNSSFDAFICSHVLEHVPDDRQALSELWRVLKPGGWGILMVPINLAITSIDEDPSVTDIGERWRRFGQHDHVRLYSKQGFIDRVMNAGFLVRQLGVDFFGHEVFQRHGITTTSVLYVVGKR
jgi:predicted SAM-dependent methyltransferase